MIITQELEKHPIWAFVLRWCVVGVCLATIYNLVR